MSVLDDVIRAEYPRFDVPADQIVADDSIADAFASRVGSMLPATIPVDTTTVRRRLLTLRKRGEHNGGLPRLRRR